jgi:hypothetical protein
MDIGTKKPDERDHASPNSRRRFLEEAGRFALATPPAVTLLLAAGKGGVAWASGGSHANNGYGNGGSDGTPGNSGKNITNDTTR